MKIHATTTCLLSLIACLGLSPLTATEQPHHRLYDGITIYLHHPEGDDFTFSLDVRDLNHTARGPAEMLVKIYRPDGSLAVREVVEDDGVVANTYEGASAGYDHEAWAYATTYSRGLTPAVRWSVWTDPDRVAALPKRTFIYPVEGAGAGLYRVILVGSPDHIITFDTDAGLEYGLSGTPHYLQGYDDLYRSRYFYIPRGTQGIDLAILQLDRPAGRELIVRDANGEVVARTDSHSGYGTAGVRFENPDAYAGQVLRVEVSDGPGDYAFSVFLRQPRGNRYGRPGGRVFAALFTDARAARAVRNGAIYHDGEVYWQAYQVKMHDWLQTLEEADFEIPDDLASNPRGFIPVGSHERPRQLAAENAIAGVDQTPADLIMHDYPAHENRQALHAAIREMHEGMSRIGPDDHVMRGLNLAYEMGSYSYFYPRPAWRIIQHSDAPDEIKEALRAFVIQVGDRLAFCRGGEMINGNALASLVQNLRYCVEAADDPMLTELFDTYWERFTTGGFHDRIGLGPSGGMQESFGYDYHYGTYAIRGWRAILADIGDPRFREAHDRMRELYSYVYTAENIPGGAWSSRTSQTIAGGTYQHRGELPWKGHGGPDFTKSLFEADEFFAARRPGYYAVTYHGRITPSWMGEGFHGQIGFSGGMLTQVHIPGHGPVLVSRLNGSYGQGMHPSNWRNFTLHGVVGRMTTGEPLVGADSEHPDARLEGDTVTGSGDVRRSSVNITRRYEFADGYIACEVELSPSTNDRILALWGGAPAHRGRVAEAYEMIPLLGFQPNRIRSDQPGHQIDLIALDSSGEAIGTVTGEPLTAAAVVLDRGGYGVVIELDRPRALTRGRQGTLLIELAGEPTPVDQISLHYRFLPYTGDRETAGVVPRAPVHPLKALPADIQVRQLAAAMADAPAQTLTHGNRTIAKLRFGLAGESLALSGRVNDPGVRPHEVPWRGSCIEVFGSMPGEESIGQVFLSPAADGREARTYRAAGARQEREPAIQLHTEPVEDGYEFEALIPLRLLALEADAEVLPLEVQITVMHRDEAVRGTLFQSTLAYLQSHAYEGFSTQAEPGEADVESGE